MTTRDRLVGHNFGAIQLVDAGSSLHIQKEEKPLGGGGGSGIYILCSSIGVVYVGQSKNVFRLVNEHFKHEST